MMDNRFACLLVLLLAVSALVAPPENTKTDPQPWGAPPPKGDPESMNRTRCRTAGFVKSIDKDGITLFWPAMRVLHLRHDPVTGDLIDLKKDTRPAVPAKIFHLGEELAKGGYDKTASNTYRITDVRIGDRVDIHYDRRNGVDICRTICIDRRPDGQVPPAPGEKPDAFRKHHEQANADQDWEEFQSPYPRKYWSSYRGDDGQFYPAPYPSESTVAVPIPSIPVAPAPRELKPKSGG